LNETFRLSLPESSVNGGVSDTSSDDNI